jgi:hypothetical protein
MKNLKVNIDETDFEKYGFKSEDISFRDLKEKISIENAKEALIKCNEIARESNLSVMTMEEINAEIEAVRNAQNRN